MTNSQKVFFQMSQKKKVFICYEFVSVKVYITVYCLALISGFISNWMMIKIDRLMLLSLQFLLVLNHQQASDWTLIGSDAAVVRTG